MRGLYHHPEHPGEGCGVRAGRASQDVTWRCKDGDNYFWGHYTNKRYDALKDLCQRAEREIDYLATIGEIPPLTSQKEKERER